MFTTRIPGLFLENCILARTCRMGYSVPKGGSGDGRVPLAETSAASPAEPAGPGWGRHQAFPQPRCCLCMSRGPLCRAVPWHKTRSCRWQGLAPAARPPQHFGELPRPPEAFLERAPSPRAKPQEWEYSHKAPTTSIPWPAQ